MSKILRDPIYGSIELDEILVKIIDTPPFQRLRRIKQLGGVSFVYPGAVHTRFEHSIGTCHIARELLKGLNSQCDKSSPAYIKPEDSICVQIAALCHDLGHGPYSHAYDMLELKGSHTADEAELKSHEYRSAAILELMTTIFDSNGMISASNHIPGYEGEELTAARQTKYTDLQFIKDLITFSKDYKKEKWIEKLTERLSQRGCDKQIFLFEIVANGPTGIDVDKMDYFARDSHLLGLSNKFDWRRYIQVTRAIYVKSKECYHLCTQFKEVDNLYELFHTRAVLHRIAYQHKNKRIVEFMILKGLAATNNCVLVQGKPILECWVDPKGAFQLLDDSIVDIVLKMEANPEAALNPSGAGITVKSGPGLTEARKWLERVVYEHKLLVFVGKSKFMYECKKGENKKQAKDRVKKEEWEILISEKEIKNKHRLISEVVTINYGDEDNDPIENHYFYMKRNLDDEPEPFTMKELKEDRKHMQVSKLLIPKVYQEEVCFWYYDTYPDSSEPNEDHEKNVEELMKHFNPARN